MTFNRRHFLASSMASTIVTPSLIQSATEIAKPFSFVLLGDLHYDKMEHHDFDWLDKNHASDLGQIQNYSRITAEIMPQLFDSVRQSIADTHAEFVVQVGDLVEGLCGNEQLSIAQNRDAIAFIESQNLDVPFLFTKGNHDITGDGATEAFNELFLPFLSEQKARDRGASQKMGSASYAIEHRSALFCFFDAYDGESLEWLEEVLAKRSSRYCFVIIHPPVVPYGARATWHLYAAERDQAKRSRLLSMLGKHNACVLGGHIHRFSTLCRETPDGGRFTQLAISSVVNSTKTRPATELDSLSDYNGDQIRVEPNHSPSTADIRRRVYETESPLVKAFAYADLPGHAVITVDDTRVYATMYSGTSRDVYRRIDLTKLLAS